jgi:hypothetical protein
MIPCPSCGTPNRRGSKYCYCCGQPLDIIFNVSCPACDRLNPGGSAFCAFCGAKIVGPPPAAQPAVAEQPAQAAHEPRKERGMEYRPRTSEPKNVKPAALPTPPIPPITRDAVAARPQRELPPWLYEQPVEHPPHKERGIEHREVEAPLPHAAPRAVAKPPLEQSRYLSDIRGALPKTEGWLSSVHKPGGKPVADEAPQPKPKVQGGCLTLPLLALLGAIALVLVSGV